MNLAAAPSDVYWVEDVLAICGHPVSCWSGEDEIEYVIGINPIEKYIVSTPMVEGLRRYQWPEKKIELSSFTLKDKDGETVSKLSW